MDKKRILVTGGAGFIGSHVAETYHNAGHEVLALDNMLRGKEENLKSGIGLAKADVRDRDAVDEIFSRFKPEVVCHHAAQVSVRESVDDPLHDADVNIAGGIKLLELSVKHGAKRFIFASTGGAIYGEQDMFPAPESHVERPLSPYGIAKLSLERYLYFYGKTHGVSWTALRYSNVYGPRQDPHGEAGVVAIFCMKLLAGDKCRINGDGKQTRDFVFVKDVARANLRALETGAEGSINIATGIETDVNEIYAHLKELTGAKEEAEHGPAMPGEQRRSVLDPSLAGKLLGWKPEVELKEGLGETVEFFKGQ